MLTIEQDRSTAADANFSGSEIAAGILAGNAVTMPGFYKAMKAKLGLAGHARRGSTEPLTRIGSAATGQPFGAKYRVSQDHRKRGRFTTYTQRSLGQLLASRSVCGFICPFRLDFLQHLWTLDFDVHINMIIIPVPQ